MTWIVDSSVAMAWCFEDEVTERTEALLDRTEAEPVVVPMHWALEVTNVLRSAVRRGRLSEAKATAKVAALISLPVRYDTVTHQVAFASTYQLARKYHLTTYDAAYLELALRLDAPLATNDEELAVAARKYHLTTYDAAYLELALRLDAPLATNDEELAVAARKAGVRLL